MHKKELKNAINSSQLDLTDICTKICPVTGKYSFSRAHIIFTKIGHVMGQKQTLINLK